ncbi:MAG: extracellular solute-binding protein [Firmicutes bacterium]|nr:extracellular solute-binding protein [Bacillota bacterium]
MKGGKMTAVIVGGAMVFSLAGCGGSGAPYVSLVKGRLANVVYAGSLEYVNNEQVGPAFEKATQFRYQGQGGGSYGMAQEIKSKTLAPNVFESIGYAPIQVIEPKDTNWAIAFAASPLVVAYSPTSRYAPELNAIRAKKRPLQDLFTLMATPGFHLGRTNPNTDPQGQAFYMMVELAVKHYHLPPGTVGQILGTLDNAKEVYSEEGILTLLQSGGLDASSAFLSEALERHLDYITLPSWMNFASPNKSSVYRTASVTLNDGTTISGQPLTVDITTVGTPDKASVGFIKFLLGSQGAAIMRQAGYQVFSPEVFGSRADVPGALKQS